MKRQEKTKILLFLNTNEERLKTMQLTPLLKVINDELGIQAQVHTIRGFRADLEWPKLTKPPTRLENLRPRVSKLERKLDYLINQLGVDLPKFITDPKETE